MTKHIDEGVETIVFSATGGTARIAEAVAAGIRERYDGRAVVYGAPVYGGHVAPPARGLIVGDSRRGLPCVIVATYGNRAFEKALADMSELATAAGMRVVGAGAFVAEHSYSRPATPIAQGRPDETDLDEAREFGRAVGERLSGSCGTESVDVSQITDLPSPPESIANFKAFVAEYQRSQREHPVKLLPTVDVRACTRCGRCVELCPTGAIADDCITVSPERCIKCSACVKGCPHRVRRLDSPFAPVLAANFSARKSAVWRVI